MRGTTSRIQGPLLGKPQLARMLRNKLALQRRYDLTDLPTARSLADWDGKRSPRAVASVGDAIDKAKFLVDELERRFQ